MNPMRILIPIISLLGPLFASAQEIPASALAFMGRIYTTILNPIIALLFVLAFVYFIWGVIKYSWSGEQESMREEGRSSIIWGIIGMFVMFSVFGILRLIIGTIGAEESVLGSI
jgi:hypothetical protein